MLYTAFYTNTCIRGKYNTILKYQLPRFLLGLTPKIFHPPWRIRTHLSFKHRAPRWNLENFLFSPTPHRHHPETPRGYLPPTHLFLGIKSCWFQISSFPRHGLYLTMLNCWLNPFSTPPTTTTTNTTLAVLSAQRRSIQTYCSHMHKAAQKPPPSSSSSSCSLARSLTLALFLITTHPPSRAGGEAPSSQPCSLPHRIGLRWAPEGGISPSLWIPLKQTPWKRQRGGGRCSLHQGRKDPTHPPFFQGRTSG